MSDLDALERLTEGRTLPWRHVSQKHAERVETVGGIEVVDARTADGNGNGDCALIVAAVNALPVLIAELRAAREVLREVEWCATDHGMGAYCPCCDGNRDWHGHEPDCRLARVLG